MKERSNRHSRTSFVPPDGPNYLLDTLELWA